MSLDSSHGCRQRRVRQARRRSEEFTKARASALHQESLGRCQRHEQTELDVHVLAERATPPADDLAVDAEDVSHQRIHGMVRRCAPQPLAERRTVPESHEELVVVRQQVRDT